MKKIALIILALCFLFPLYGCGDSNINSVKEGTLFFDTATTIGNVFDSYPYFESSEWSSFEDEQKRVFVQFEGEFNSDAVLDNVGISGELGEYLREDLQERTILLENKVYLTVQFIILGDDFFEVSYVGTRLDNGKSLSYNAENALKQLYSGSFPSMFSNLVQPQLVENILSRGGPSASSADNEINGTWIVGDIEGSIASSLKIRRIMENATPEGREAVRDNYRETMLTIDLSKRTLNGMYVGMSLDIDELNIVSEDSEVVILEEFRGSGKMKLTIIDEDNIVWEGMDGLILKLVRK